jgi:hypothetical protein
MANEEQRGGVNAAALEPLVSDRGDGEVNELRAQLQELRQKRSYYGVIGRFVPVTGVLIFMGLFGVYFKWDSQLALVIGTFYLIVAIAFPAFTYAGALDTEIEAVESEIALRLTGAEATEQRAERLFRSHGIDLRRYYQQTLRHSAFVFAAGIGCIALGFGVIGYAFYILKGNGDIQEKMLTAALGLISGVLTNFVAVIYLKMFAETIAALTGFHKKLVTTNHLHFANFLLAKISDPTKRDESYAKLANSIAIPGALEKGDA